MNESTSNQSTIASVIFILAILLVCGYALALTDSYVMVISFCLWIVLPIFLATFLFRFLWRLLQRRLCSANMLKTMNFLYGRDKAEFVLSQYGVQQFLESNFEKAIRAFECVLTQNIESANYWANLGGTRYYAGQLPEAVEDLTKALLINEHHQLASTYRAYALSTMEQYPAALDDLEKVQCTDKEHYDVAYLRGRIRELLHLWKPAFDDYRLASRLDDSQLEPKICDARLLSGCPESQYRNGKLALKMAKELCEKTDWKDWLPVSVLGAAYSELNDFENALVYAQMALELAPEEEKPERQKRIEQFSKKIPFRIPETNRATGKEIEANE